MSMKFYRNIKTGETGYIDVKEEYRPTFDANKVYGCGYSADYKFINFVIHAAIAGITGFITASIINSTILGIIIGIISFIISTIIHIAIKGELFTCAARKDTVVKQIITYVISIGAAIGITAIVNTIFGMGIAAIVAIVAVIVVILIIKHTDRFQV